MCVSFVIPSRWAVSSCHTGGKHRRPRTAAHGQAKVWTVCRHTDLSVFTGGCDRRRQAGRPRILCCDPHGLADRQAHEFCPCEIQSQSRKWTGDESTGTPLAPHPVRPAKTSPYESAKQGKAGAAVGIMCDANRRSQRASCKSADTRLPAVPSRDHHNNTADSGMDDATQQ